MSKALLVVAHGSRRVESNDEVRTITKKLAIEQKLFNAVSCAFLELAEPSIPEGLRLHIEKGVTEIVVLPYFLSAGRHVIQDIPNEIAIIERQYPTVKITLAPYLGAAKDITELLLTQAIIASV